MTCLTPHLVQTEVINLLVGQLADMNTLQSINVEKHILQLMFNVSKQPANAICSSGVGVEVVLQKVELWCG